MGPKKIVFLSPESTFLKPAVGGVVVCDDSPDLPALLERDGRPVWPTAILCATLVINADSTPLIAAVVVVFFIVVVVATITTMPSSSSLVRFAFEMHRLLPLHIEALYHEKAFDSWNGRLFDIERCAKVLEEPMCTNSSLW